MEEFWTTDDLRRSNISPSTIRTMISQGKLERLTHGVYVRPHADGLTRLRAVCHRWPKVIFSGTTAAHIYGWEELAWPIHGLLPRTTSPVHNSEVILTRSHNHNSRIIHGLPVTSPAITAHLLLDSWPSAKLINFLERSYAGIKGEAQYLRDSRSLSPTGRSALNKIAAKAVLGASSSTERRLAHALADKNVFTRSNVKIGPYTYDLKVIGSPLLIEVDGQRFHTNTGAFVRDRWKTNAAQRAGYTLLCYSDTCIDYVLDEVVEQIISTARSLDDKLMTDSHGVFQWHRALSHPLDSVP
ncbi:type IV toxin-antitoxin system AbiEi family antitoxin domain-containing protein [Corynebacterium mastitidis]|uniref:type IV toxin-antitoxin system AbiEi family antitoxin domain-containing protein n=1 Tax=Corynebacterium mastitidis TaxID=161890 RepID=UPI003BEF15D2